MESPAFIEEFEITIPSDTTEGQAVQERIVKLLEELNYPPRDVFGVRLALEEALVNAIKHGNQLDPEKIVQIGFTVNEEGFSIEIRDEGPGFDMADVPDPTDPENLERPTGRGLFLMHAYMTECNFIPPGNICRMKRVR